MYRPARIRPLPGLPAGQCGFTLVELITVMVVVGVLAAAVIPKFFDRKGFAAIAYTDQVRALIRFGQKVAIAQNRNIFVRLDGTGVALCYDSSCASHLMPGNRANSGSSATLASCSNAGNWACEGAPTGLAITQTETFYFDANGKPFALADAPPTLASTFQARTVTISGDGLNHNVVISAETGYVY